MDHNINIQFIQTQDGSHTLYHTGVGDIYHSRHGALTESRYVFIDKGFHYFIPREKINILEIGFGTGLNTFLTLIESRFTDTEVYYESVEKYPLDMQTVKQLNYPGILNDREGLFLKMHEAAWNKEHKITSSFTLKKVSDDLHYYGPGKKFDMVYFDAFSPDVQPDLWSREVFRKLSGGLIKGGILITYSSKSSVQKALRDSGFQINKLPGPPGKREILRAVKI